jgi:hypothetical protein
MRGRSRRDGENVACQISPFCAAQRAVAEVAATAPNGGYLKPSPSMPRLTRTSVALTCSQAVLTQ